MHGDPDIIVVGAGPTGLALAAQLRAFGVRFRLVDRSADRARESRALAVQARTLELFQSLGLGEALVRRGNSSARLMLHLDPRRSTEVRLGEFGASDTRYPFILFVSQAETEALLAEHLQARGVPIERSVELTDLRQDEERVYCRLRHSDGHDEEVTTRWVAGCDGAHSAVRKLVALPFAGGAYAQDFLLGDVEIDGPLEPDALHSFTEGGAVAMIFPLRSPASWRVIAMAPDAERREDASQRQPAAMMSALPLPELQSAVDRATGGGFRLHSPVWLTHFRLHHRQAGHYRAGRVFLAGDAAHIHSPVGAQGMNTGIQDAWNLGWKLALVSSGSAAESLLDSYEAERWPVGRFLLHYTDRLFGVLVRVTSAGRLARWVRRNVAGRVLPIAARSRRLRTLMFRFVSELDIHYRTSAIVSDGTPRLSSGVRPGDRLPDGRVTRDGRDSWLQEEAVGAHVTLLLCGSPDRWNAEHVEGVKRSGRGWLVIEHLARSERSGALVDPAGYLLRRLGVRNDLDAAQYVIRPDGYVAFRCAGHDLAQVRGFLDCVRGRAPASET